MDKMKPYREIVQDVLTEYAAIPYSYGEIERELVFDIIHDRYLYMTTGWMFDRRVHSAMIHIDIKDGKIWIQRDGTEEGIANALMQSGIPKEHIVLAFHPADVRPYTGFAIA